MHLDELVAKWNNLFRYDYWWRQKHNVAFGSKQHREMLPSDIAFEYFEHQATENVIAEIKQEKKKEKLLKEGNVFNANKKVEDKLWDSISLKDFNS